MVPSWPFVPRSPLRSTKQTTLTHEDFQHDPYAGDAEGEMRAEAEAERRADAALELAAELASCDWEGWD